jgi:hypothetical protein
LLSGVWLRGAWGKAVVARTSLRRYLLRDRAGALAAHRYDANLTHSILEACAMAGKACGNIAPSTPGA